MNKKSMEIVNWNFMEHIIIMVGCKISQMFGLDLAFLLT